MTFKERRRLFWVFTSLFAVLALPILLYATGWRLTSEFTFKRTGGLFVGIGESDVEIFVNGELEKRTNLLQSGLFLQGLTPGKISVIAAKVDTWPWAKELEIEESSVTEARPFLVPREPKGEMLVHGNYTNIYVMPENELLVLENIKNGIPIFDFYNPISRSFVSAADAAPLLKSGAFSSITEDILDSRERVKVSIANSGNEITSEWISDKPLPYFFEKRGEISVFKSRAPVRGIEFYPGRRDVILLTVENGIFALELDGRGTRNFQPIYKGKNPTFAILGNLIYILDDGRLFEVKL